MDNDNNVRNENDDGRIELGDEEVIIEMLLSLRYTRHGLEELCFWTDCTKA